jgi:RND superfamily putative drug exporter
MSDTIDERLPSSGRPVRHGTVGLLRRTDGRDDRRPGVPAPATAPAVRLTQRRSLAEAVTGLLGRRRWTVLVVWALVLAVAGVVGGDLSARVTPGGWSVSGSESDLAAAAVRDGFLARGEAVTVVVRDEWYTVDQPRFAERVRSVMADLAGRSDLDVTGSYGWATLGADARALFEGDDGRTVLTVLSSGLKDGPAARVLPEVQRDLDDGYSDQGLRVALVSAAAFRGELTKLSEDGLASAELVTLPLVALLLLLLYRSLVAALVSLVVAVTAVVVAIGVLAVVARWVELSVFVRSAVTMLGLGVGVDYALFVISRFSTELAGGATTRRAVATTLRTSGETVLSSALVVVLAMATLFLVPLGAIRSIALGAIVVVALAALTSVLVLPALLLLLGPRIQALRIPLPRRRAGSSGGWESFTRRTMRRPGTVLAVSLVLLLALAWPALQLHVFTADARILPTSSSVREGQDLVREAFGDGATAPITVVVSSPTPLATSGADGDLVDLQQHLEQLPDVTGVKTPLRLMERLSPGRPLAALDHAVRDQLRGDVAAAIDHFVSKDGRRIVLEVVPADAAASLSTRSLLVNVRTEARRALAGSGLSVVVGGQTAEGVDSNRAITDRLPVALALMLGVIFLVLLATFRSLLLPLKAIVVNLLSAAAAFGVLVLVFQRGVGAGLLGVEPSGDLQNIVPVLLLALLFSLSTDYEIFLLARVREEWLATGDGTASVARGVARTGPLITGAAVLMVAVFGAFTLTASLPLKQLGLGLAVAIALDATVIRLLVVPASMCLLGAWNWWPDCGRPRSAVPTHRPAGVPVPRQRGPRHRAPRPVRTAPTRPTENTRSRT